MIERFERFKKPVALAVISTLGLTACADNAGQSTSETTSSPSVETPKNGIKREVVYSEDGSRTIYLDGSIENQGYNFVGAYIYQFCDGKDLVEETLRNWRVAAGIAVSRSVLHPACADGKLTEADFPTH